MLKEFENLIPFPSRDVDITINLTHFSSPAFTNEELKNLLQFFRHRNHNHYMIVKFLLSTGVSIPDLIHFKTKDIDYENGSLTMKGGKRLHFRRICVEKSFLQEIYRYSCDFSAESHLFEGRKGCSREERSIQKILNTASQFLRKEINIPIIRDSIALSLYQSGNPIREIQFFLGHRSLKSTRQRILAAQLRIDKQTGHNFESWKEKAA
jgi:integrase